MARGHCKKGLATTVFWLHLLSFRRLSLPPFTISMMPFLLHPPPSSQHSTSALVALSTPSRWIIHSIDPLLKVERGSAHKDSRRSFHCPPPCPVLVIVTPAPCTARPTALETCLTGLNYTQTSWRTCRPTWWRAMTLHFALCSAFTPTRLCPNSMPSSSPPRSALVCPAVQILVSCHRCVGG
jgi:hypothetical protein